MPGQKTKQIICDTTCDTTWYRKERWRGTWDTSSALRNALRNALWCAHEVLTLRGQDGKDRMETLSNPSLCEKMLNYDPSTHLLTLAQPHPTTNENENDATTATKRQRANERGVDIEVQGGGGQPAMGATPPPEQPSSLSPATPLLSACYVPPNHRVDLRTSRAAPRPPAPGRGVGRRPGCVPPSEG